MPVFCTTEWCCNIANVVIIACRLLPKVARFITLRAKLSGAVYCNGFCLCVFVGLFVGLLPQ